MPAHNASSNLAQGQGATLASNGSISALYVQKIYDLYELNGTASPGLKIAPDTKVSFFGATPVTQQSALTAALTTVTCSSPGTPDYAIADGTQTTPFGFVSLDEMLSVLKALANCQIRLGQVETILENMGICAAN